MSEQKRRPFLIKHLSAAVEAHYKLPKGSIKSTQRAKRIAIARHMASLIARTELGMSYPQIGYNLGRDHSTVLHGVRAAGKLIQQESFAADYRIILALAEKFARKEGYFLQALRPAPPKPTLPQRRPPAPTPVRAVEKSVGAAPRAAQKIVSSPWDDCYPPRQWWAENNERFCAAMRKIHPEREVRNA